MNAGLRNGSWNDALRSPRYRLQLFITLAVLAAMAVFVGRFFHYIESRRGTVLNDPLLDVLPAYDVSVAIFTLIYLGILISLVNVVRQPYLLLRTAQAYLCVNILRACSILWFPLEPPAGMVTLRDPLVDAFFYNDQVITKDLFFSGHVSVLATLAAAVSMRWLRLIVLGITITVGTLLLVQHAHYTIDVVAGLIVGWGVSIMILKWRLLS